MCATTRWLGRPGKASPVSIWGAGVVGGVSVASCALEDIAVGYVAWLVSCVSARALLWLRFPSDVTKRTNKSERSCSESRLGGPLKFHPSLPRRPPRGGFILHTRVSHRARRNHNERTNTPRRDQFRSRRLPTRTRTSARQSR